MAAPFGSPDGTRRSACKPEARTTFPPPGFFRTIALDRGPAGIERDVKHISIPHGKIRPSVRPAPFSGVIAACLLSPHLSAADFIWDGGAPGTNSWGAVNNWNPDASVPNNGSADLVFSGGTRPMPNAQGEYSINTLRFSGTTTAFTVTGQKITLVQNGGQPPFIRNEAASTHVIENALAFGNPGTIRAQNGHLWLKGPLDNGGHSLTLTADAGRILYLGVSGESVPLFGAGNVTVSGSGTARFNSVNLASGAFTVSSGSTAEIAGIMAGQSSISLSGTLKLMAANRIPNNVPLSLSGGRLDLDGFAETIGTLSGTGSLTGQGIRMGGGGSLTVQQTTDTSYSGTISGGGGSSFTKSGSGTLTLSGLVNYPGTTTVAGGTLHIGTGSSLSENAALVVNSGATLSMAGITRLVPSITGSGTVVLGHLSPGVTNADFAFSGTFTGGGSLTKIGTGVMEITTPQSHTGGTHIGNGVLHAKASQALGAAGATTISPGATLRIDRGVAIDRPGGITLVGTGAAGAGVVQVMNTGADTNPSLTGPITLLGPATINSTSSRTFNLGSANGLQTLDLGKFDLTLNSARVRHRLAGEGGIVKTGTGTLRLAGNNSAHTGPIDIQNGTLELESNNALAGGNAPVTIAPGAKLVQRDGIATSTARIVHLEDDFEAYGVSSWSGTDRLDFQFGSRLVARSSPAADLTIGGSGEITGLLFEPVVESGAIVRVQRPVTVGDGLYKSGPGILEIGAPCTYPGPTHVTAGTLRLTAPDCLPDQTEFVLSAGATFDTVDHDERIGSLDGLGTVTLGGTLTLSPLLPAAFAGTIQGSGGIIFDGGSAVQTLASANTYTGPTNVRNNGKLTLAAADALSPTARLTVQSGGELRIGATGQTIGSLTGNGAIIHTAPGGTLQTGGESPSLIWSGTIQGPGGLVKTGALTGFILSTAQPYTGPTTIEEGSLSSVGLPSSDVTIAANAQLSGSGTFADIDCSGRIANRIAGSTLTANALTLRHGSRVQMIFNNDWTVPEAIHAATLERIGGNITIASAILPVFTPGETRVLKVIRTTHGITGSTSGITVSLGNSLAAFDGTATARVSADGKDLEVVFTAATGDDYESWINGFGLAEGQKGFDHDADHDGLPNGIEYILGGNPATGPDSEPVLSFTHDGTHMEFVFTRMNRAEYLDPMVQHSTTLQNPWTPAVHGQNGVTITETIVDPERKLITVRIPKSGAPRRFARLRADL